MYIMYNNVSKNPFLSLVLLCTWYGESTLGNTKTVVGDALISSIVHFVGQPWEESPKPKQTHGGVFMVLVHLGGRSISSCYVDCPN